MDSQILTVLLDKYLCRGCSLCIDACPPEVLFITDQFNVLGYQYAQYTGNGCTGCEACFYICPEPGVFTVLKPAEELSMKAEKSAVK